MQCNELRRLMADLEREPSDAAVQHLEQCAECRVWLDGELARSMPELSALSAEVPAAVFARVRLPEPAVTAPSIWKSLFTRMALGLTMIGIVMMLLVSQPSSQPVSAPESWSFLAPVENREWGFVEQASNAEMGLAFVDQRELVGELQFLDNETTYTFLEEEQS